MAADEEPTGIDFAGIGKLAETVKEVVKPFLDPVLSESGGYVADRIRFLRFRQGLRVAQKAKALLDQLQIPVNPVPLNILVPILEGASLEEDQELVEQWARLLASASAGEQITPLFPAILARMTSLEARVLQWLWDRMQIQLEVSTLEERPRSPEILWEELVTHFEFSTWECEYLLDRLQAQQLILVTTTVKDRAIGRIISLSNSTYITFTALDS
ncbi:MAG TPA: Abi-alpha family protein [Thermoanaerobaculia bacterium]|jgi:hypothetical protein